jgi:serine/threonine protein kinase
MNLETMCVSCLEDDSGSTICPKCGSPFHPTVSNTLMLPPRTVLRDQYVIGRALGHGGFGITYLAWDIGLQTRLAIKEYMPNGIAGRTGQSKVLPFSDITKPEYEWGLERFLEEARVLKKCNHPHIVAVDTVFRDNGTAYLVMEYLEGMTFEELLRRRGGTIPFEEALRIMLPVMDALSAVHAENILHRDVSPDNIYIPRTGKVKLIDFGAARNALSQRSRNLSVIMRGGYSPEEQYRSNGIQGPWTDVYATAATLYRAVTGKVPPASIDRLAADTLESPSQLGVSIPASAEIALMKGLAVRAGDRFQSMEDFKSALTGNLPVPRPAPVTVLSETRALDETRRTLVETLILAPVAPAQPPAVVPPPGPPAPQVIAGPVPAAPVAPPPPPRVRRTLPKWLVLALLIAIVALAATGGSIYWYRHRHRPTTTASSTTPESGSTTPAPGATSPTPAAGSTQWPTQAAGIPQSDEERQRALEAQAENPVAPEPQPVTVEKPAPPAPAPVVAVTPAPAPVEPAPAPVVPPPAPVVTSYDELLRQAEVKINNVLYTDAQTLLNSAIQANPSRWQAYNALAKIELYYLNQPADAFINYRAALDKGGVASFLVYHDHSDNFITTCQGWLSVSRGKASFKANDGVHTFSTTAVKDAKRNKTGMFQAGRARHAFHIRLMSGPNYNFAPSSAQPGQEVDFIVGAVGKS